MKNPNTWYSNIGWSCLLIDGVMGFMLLLAPLTLFRVSGVYLIPCELVFVRLIGVFTICVGVCYVVPRILSDVTAQAVAWQTVFVCTGVLRACVAMFVVWGFGRGYLDRGWLVVPAYGASLAALQFWVLCKKGSD